MNRRDSLQLEVSLGDLLKLQAEAQRLRLPSVRGRARRHPGQRPSPYHGRGLSFSEHRIYQPGDDIRHIDWRVTARHNEPHTKCYEEERERPLLLVCDLTASLVFSSGTALKSHRVLEAAAILIWLGLAQGDRVGAIVASPSGIESFRPARRRQQALQILQALVRHHNNLIGSTDTEPGRLDESLSESARTLKTGGRLMVIGDFLQIGEQTETLMRRLASHNVATALRICDPLDLRAPPPGRYGLMGDHGPLWINAADPGFRDQLEERLSNYEQDLNRLFARAGSHYFCHSTDSSLRPLLANMAA